MTNTESFTWDAAVGAYHPLRKRRDFPTSFAHALLRASVGVALVGTLLGCTSESLAVPADDLSDATIACLVSKGATSDPTDRAEQLHTTRDALTACWWGR